MSQHYWDRLLANLKDLRAFVWEGRYKVQHDREFVDTVHNNATGLYNKFHVSNVPLVSIDMKYKLVRLSTALALGTCNFNEVFDTVTVTKEHVDYIAGFLDDVYTKAGLHEGASKDRKGEVDEAQVKEIIDVVCKKIDSEEEKVVKILKWMAEQATFSKDELKTTFGLARDNELVPLLTVLQNEHLIVRGRGYVMTSRGVKMVKILLGK